MDRSKPLVALQFPGQGPQHVGMGRDLCDVSGAAAAIFAQADEVLGYPLSRLCFEGPLEALNDTSNTQPAILTTSIAALRALEQQLGPVAFVAGHSLGEFSGLVAAGALPFEETLLLVQKRGQLMKEAGDRNPGRMAAVLGLETAVVDRLCAQVCEDWGGYVGIANDNCPGQVVISGDERTLQKGIAAMEAAGARRVVLLAVSIAAHSPLMAEAAVLFGQALGATSIQPPMFPIIANATAGPLIDPDQIRDALGRQLTSPVHWTESVRFMIGEGVTRFIEVGPGEVLTGLLRRIDRDVERLATTQLLTSRA